MQEIPNWIIKIIETEDLVCRACKKKFYVDDLMSISVQESSSSPYSDFLCIGMFCGKCKELIIFELKEMTLIDFAFEIIDQETSNKIKKNKKEITAVNSAGGSKRKKRTEVKKSKITLKEVEDIRKFLKTKGLLHEDVLIAMGMLPEDIGKYNYKK